MPDIEPISLAIEVPVAWDIAWAALTEPDEVERWFAVVTPLGQPGDAYGVDFGDENMVQGELRAVQPGRRFSHTWRWAEDDAAATTLVTWSVEPAGTGRSRVRLVHEGWSEAGLDQERRDDHAGYWEEYLAALEKLFAAGE